MLKKQRNTCVLLRSGNTNTTQLYFLTSIADAGERIHSPVLLLPQVLRPQETSKIIYSLNDFAPIYIYSEIKKKRGHLPEDFRYFSISRVALRLTDELNHRGIIPVRPRSIKESTPLGRPVRQDNAMRNFVVTTS